MFLGTHQGASWDGLSASINANSASLTRCGRQKSARELTLGSLPQSVAPVVAPLGGLENGRSSWQSRTAAQVRVRNILRNAVSFVLLSFLSLAGFAAEKPKVKIMPEDQVKAGMHGVAYTVFEGVTPEPMEVEILGVLKDAIGPGQDMILARLHGEKPEYTGVVAGMSGSPVYIDGRLAGALSYRIGQFSKEPICGITPIEQMFEVRDGHAAGGVRLASVAGEADSSASLRNDNQVGDASKGGKADSSASLRNDNQRGLRN